MLCSTLVNFGNTGRRSMAYGLICRTFSAVHSSSCAASRFHSIWSKPRHSECDLQRNAALASK